MVVGLDNFHIWTPPIGQIWNLNFPWQLPLCLISTHSEVNVNNILSKSLDLIEKVFDVKKSWSFQVRN